MNAPLTDIEQLQLALPDLDWITDTNRVARLSQDFSWFSPVLKPQLQGKSAHVAVRPRTEAEIRALVATCARLRLPITVRGGGTGNYGQAVPMHGGVLLDLSSYNAMLWVRAGVARAQAGIRLAQFDAAAQAQGWEMRCLPSTYRSATLGGLFGGGFGGVGSINHGPLAATGNVLGIKVMSVEAEPQVHELRGAEALVLHHAYGCNGVVLEIEVALAAALPWQENIAVFPEFEPALLFAQAVASGPGLVKKEVCLLAAPIPAYQTALADHLPAGCHAVLMLLAPSADRPMRELLELHGGTLTYHQTFEEVQQSRHTLVEHTWNHTTLHALKVDKTLTYLQSSFTPGQHLEQMRHMQSLVGDEVLLHAEFLRTTTGELTCSALQLVRYTTPERLNALMDLYRANGVRINNPHTHWLEDGKAGGELPPEVVAMKHRMDPLGLLNPGKMRTWSATPNPTPVHSM
jgi:FAD/FMN-containing dehydrogenase